MTLTNTLKVWLKRHYFNLHSLKIQRNCLTELTIVFDWQVIFGNYSPDEKQEWTNSPEDGHKIEGLHLTCLQEEPACMKTSPSNKRQLSLRYLLSIDLAFSKYSCWDVDNFHEWHIWVLDWVNITGVKKKTWHFCQKCWAGRDSV